MTRLSPHRNSQKARFPSKKFKGRGNTYVVKYVEFFEYLEIHGILHFSPQTGVEDQHLHRFK